jgi:ABC-type antimicrobial peptide transport system permease subunit
MIDYRLIGPGYFETLGAQMAEGGAFSAADVQQGRQVAIVNQAAARLLFGRQPAMGRMLETGIGRRGPIVGVVKDIRTEGLDRPAPPMVYLPYFPGFGLRFIVRTSAAPGTVLPLLKARLRQVNPGIVVQQYRLLEDDLDATVRQRRVSGVLVGGFALIGLLIGSVGLYGTLAAQVQRREREIGVRVALGATVRGVMADVVGEGLRIVALGAAAGVAGAVFAGRLIERELYGVGPLDPASFGLALALLSAAGLAASLVPALKAARMDPGRALNQQ